MTAIQTKITTTKASIVQRLLDEKSITAEEAVVLLETPSIQYIPTPQPYMPLTSPTNTPYIYGVPNGTISTT